MACSPSTEVVTDCCTVVEARVSTPRDSICSIQWATALGLVTAQRAVTHGCVPHSNTPAFAASSRNCKGFPVNCLSPFSTS